MEYFLNLECSDAIIHYDNKFNEYGIMIHDGGTSHIIIKFCPWCGRKLPESKRDLWFQTLENMGYKNFDTNKIPKKFRTDEWYTED